MLKIEYRKAVDLTPYENNSRTHSKEQVDQIVESIKEFGFTNPILVDEKGGIIAGHGRLEAAQRLSLEEVPTITLKGLSEAQKRAYVIADNKLALNAGWDYERLRSEIEALEGLDFDTRLLGFTHEELLGLIGEPVEIDAPEDFKEVGEESLAHRCPKCGYEFDDV
jgi:ParB family transcriptional regulator, chromosome partitioning protein